MGKKYRTRDGRAVRVLAVDLNRRGWPVEAFVEDHDKSTGATHAYTDNGKFTRNGIGEHEADLIEITPFDDLKIDDPVVVTIGSQGSVGQVFHFAGTTEDGRPKVWAQGRTSLTVKSKQCDWWVPVGCKPYVAE